MRSDILSLSEDFPSIFFGEHDRQHAVGYRGISGVGRVTSKGAIQIIDLEKDQMAFSLIIIVPETAMPSRS